MNGTGVVVRSGKQQNGSEVETICPCLGMCQSTSTDKRRGGRSEVED